MVNFINLLKKLPVDLGQAEYRRSTGGKLIARSLVPDTNGSKALDIGCREGHQSEWLREKGYSVEAIDENPRCEAGKTVDVNQGLPYEADTFYLVWCSEVLEHLADPHRAVEEMRRVTRDNGKLLLTTPNSYFWLYYLLGLLGFKPADVQNPGHKHFFSYSDVQSLFPEADIYGYFPYNFKKFRIENFRAVELLSPTFVIHETTSPA